MVAFETAAGTADIRILGVFGLNSLSLIAKLLYFSNGITAMLPYADKPFYMRASPSAGGLYPTEIYVIVQDYKGLENGIYNFQVSKQGIAYLQKGDFKDELLKITFNHPSVNECNLFIVLTGVFYRSSWRYQDRAYRRICLDTGHVIGNIDPVGYSLDIKPILIGGFNDKLANELLSLDENEEQTLAIIPLLENKKIKNDSVFLPSALPSKLIPQNTKTPEGMRLLELHNRSRINNFSPIPNVSVKDTEEKFKFSAQIPLIKELKIFNWKNNLLNTIIKRRSTRAFSGAPLQEVDLIGILDFAYHSELFVKDKFDTAPAYFDLSLLETFVAVNSMEGFEDGCYYYSKKGRYFRQVRFKNFREEIHYLCLGQELGLKASAVIFHTCDLSRAIFKYGERAYRYIHMDAGHLGERVNLAAINLDLGVSGIGGFFDDNVNEILGIPEDQAVVYITVLGYPHLQIDG